VEEKFEHLVQYRYAGIPWTDYEVYEDEEKANEISAYLRRDQDSRVITRRVRPADSPFPS